MLAVLKLIRSLGVGGLLGGGVAGGLFLVYPALFPAESELEEVVLVAALWGAALYKLLLTTVVKPLSYYRGLLELHLVRHQIGQQTRAEITRELTFKYFLGDNPGTPKFSDKREETQREQRLTPGNAIHGGANGAARGDGSAAY